MSGAAGRGFRELEHTADRAIEAWGETLADVFCAAAEGMFSQSEELEGVPREREWRIEVRGDSLEELLHAWLSELLWVAERDEAVACAFEVEALEENPWRLRGRARGGPIRSDRPHTGAPVKAVTYHDLRVWQEAGPSEAGKLLPNGGPQPASWRAHVVFDV